jgi:hypothetical protein
MVPENHLALPTPLESVRYQFEKWRETRKSPRETIPEYLWEAAAKLHDKYPISRISKALGLSLAKKQPSPLFVELAGVESFATSECIVEMENDSGSKMRMHFKGKADLDLLELSKAFWKRGK